MKIFKRILIALVVFLAMLVSLLVGAFLQSRGVGPLSLFKSFIGIKVDSYQRLVAFPGKSPIPCPAIRDRMEVLLLMGQSNAANFAEQRHFSEYGHRVVNFFDGRCYEAGSPLLGSSAARGEPWTLLANKMISGGLADTVVLIPTAIGSTSIEEWAPGGGLHPMLLEILDQITRHGYLPTRVIWHQGESDFKKGTPPIVYREKFEILVAALRSKGVLAPIYPSVATAIKDYPGWRLNNGLAAAQRSLREVAGVAQVVDTDLLITFADRYDGTHFGRVGQEKFSDALVSAFKSGRSADNVWGR